MTGDKKCVGANCKAPRKQAGSKPTTSSKKKYSPDSESVERAKERRQEKSIQKNNQMSSPKQNIKYSSTSSNKETTVTQSMRRDTPESRKTGEEAQKKYREMSGGGKIVKTSQLKKTRRAKTTKGGYGFNNTY